MGDAFEARSLCCGLAFLGNKQRKHIMHNGIYLTSYKIESCNHTIKESLVTNVILISYLLNVNYRLK